MVVCQTQNLAIWWQQIKTSSTSSWLVPFLYCFICTKAREDETKAQLSRFRLEVTCWPPQRVSQHLVLKPFETLAKWSAPLSALTWNGFLTMPADTRAEDFPLNPFLFSCGFFFPSILNASVSSVSSCPEPLCNGDFPKRAFPPNYSPSPSSRGRRSHFVLTEVWHVNSLHTLLFHF